MKNATITRTKNTVSAPYLPYAAYNALVAKANALNAKIVHNADHTTVVTCKTAKDAKTLVAEWTADYEANKKPSHAPEAYDPAREYEDLMDGFVPTNAPKKASPRKARKAKGNSVDFNAFKGTKSDKNKALHAMLVSMGMKDSRTAEYQAVWNARPWAN